MFSFLASATHTETELKSVQKLQVECEDLQLNKKTLCYLLWSNQLDLGTTNQQCIVYLSPEVCP